MPLSTFGSRSEFELLPEGRVVGGGFVEAGGALVRAAGDPRRRALRPATLDSLDSTDAPLVPLTGI